ncbi:MAG: lasso RiPP family leader peptide-containing protein [Acidimicrobiales bacterium]
MGNRTDSYQAPALTKIGTLHELTLQNKVFASPSDFHYPNNLSFNFS